MERRLLDPGDLVAVYPYWPVPVDPYNDLAAGSILVAEVLNPRPESGGVMIGVSDGWDTVRSRQVIARWDDYVERRAARVDANRTDAERRAQRLAVEARILSAARTLWPNATIVGDTLVIPLDDWINAADR
jgi:hypothetical protein